jgi:hypothetical protein
MNYCKIENGVVTNISHWESPMPPGWAAPGDTWVQSDVAGPGWTYANGVFTAPPVPAAPPPTNLSVDAERDRRRNLPISITTSPTGAFQINMDDISQQNIAGLATAGIVLNSAAPAQTTAFRDIANVTHNLLPSELVSMGLQVMAHIGALYAKSWALKAMSPIPVDYAADHYWS